MLIASLVLLFSCDAIGPDIQNNPLVEPTYEYEIDTWGANSEMYEFTPKGSPNYNCIVFLTDSALRPAMECVPKAVTLEDVVNQL